MKKSSFLLVIFCLLATVYGNASHQGQQNNEKPSGTISGRITIQGKPAVGIELALKSGQDDVSNTITARGKTDKDGRYKFTDIKSNYYWLQVVTEEYVNTYGIDRNMVHEKAGRRILVTNGEAVMDGDLDISLGGTISGRIVDIDGKPVTDEPVSVDIPLENHRHIPLEDEDDLEPLFCGSPKTDSNGTYKIKGLLPGRYAISIGVNTTKPTKEESNTMGWGAKEFYGRVGANRYFEETFYQGVKEINKIVFIEVGLGKEVKNINFKTIGRAKKAYSASGRVIDEKTGKPVKNCDLWVGYKYEGGSRATKGLDKTDENGYFKIDGLLSGEYFVGASLPDEADSYSEVVTYEIKNADVSGLEVHMYPGLTVTGKIVIEGEPNPFAIAKLSQIKLDAASVKDEEEQAGSQKEIAVSSDGTFKITGLIPDKLNISFSEPYFAFSIVKIENPNGLPVQEAEPGDGEAGSSFNPFVLTLERDLTDVRIFVRYKNVSTLKGQVNITGGKLPANLPLTVSYSRKAADGSDAMASSMFVDADGKFTNNYLEPGEYRMQLIVDGKPYNQPKTVKVAANSEINVSIDLDLQTIKKSK